MVSEPGKRRVRDREIETLDNLWTLAGFVATETFDETIDRELELDIQDAETHTLSYDGRSEMEVTN